MGVALSGLIKTEETDINKFKDKIIAVDAMNMLYQFATTIRQQDGTPLKDSKGNVTSHLTGLFSRISKLMIAGLKLVFVFDGEMPLLKKIERERRDKLKTEAIQSFEEAKERGDVLEMKRFASRTTRVSKDMVDESIKLIRAFGLPVIRSPSEGEAQASYMVSKGDCHYVSSQDYDCLIYGAPRVVRNLSLTQKRKKINALTYKTILPEILELNKVLKELNLDRDRLIALAMIIGTDFNVGGVKGLGPKKGLKLVQENHDLEKLFLEINFDEICGVSWKEVFKTIKEMPVSDDYKLEWNNIDEEKILEILVENHEFNRERITNALENIQKEMKKARQTSLGNFF